MLRLNSSDPTVVSLRFAAVALFLANCAPTAEPVEAQGGSTGKGGDTSAHGGTNSGSGGSTSQGNGGATTSMGGANTSMGGAMGGSTSSNGGSTSSNGGSTTTNGGATTGAGGTTTGSGGTTTTGSGGSTTTTCSAYPGTGKDSTIFKDGFGAATTGKWSGYVFSYPYGTATIAPNSKVGTGCFHGAKVCAAGTVPADYDSGAAIGWNIGQALGASVNTAAAITGSVKFTVSGAIAGMRFNLAPETGTGANFCYILTAADATAAATGLTLAATAFAQSCYDTTKAVPYAGSAIASIQVEVAGDKAGAKSFDFCLVDFEPG